MFPFLPQEIEDIILDYKKQLDNEEVKYAYRKRNCWRCKKMFGNKNVCLYHQSILKLMEEDIDELRVCKKKFCISIIKKRFEVCFHHLDIETKRKIIKYKRNQKKLIHS